MPFPAGIGHEKIKSGRKNRGAGGGAVNRTGSGGSRTGSGSSDYDWDHDWVDAKSQASERVPQHQRKQKKNLKLCNTKEDVDILISQTEGLSIQSQQVRRAFMTRYGKKVLGTVRKRNSL